jgi:hypothetical protein
VDIILIIAAGVGLAAPLFYLFSPWLDFANYDLPGWLGVSRDFYSFLSFAGAE